MWFNHSFLTIGWFSLSQIFCPTVIVLCRYYYWSSQIPIMIWFLDLVLIKVCFFPPFFTRRCFKADWCWFVVGSCDLCMVSTWSLICKWWKDGACSWDLVYSVKLFCKGRISRVFDQIIMNFCLRFSVRFVKTISQFHSHLHLYTKLFSHYICVNLKQTQKYLKFLLVKRKNMLENVRYMLTC